MSGVSQFQRSILLFVVLFVYSRVGFAQNCLIAQYNFTGNAKDSVGTNHGTVYNAVLTPDRFGRSSSAYFFSSSSSSSLQIPYTNFFVPNYTYSIWVKPSLIPASGSTNIFLSFGGQGGDQNVHIENNRYNNSVMGYHTGFSVTAYQKNGSTVSVGGTSSGTLPDTGKWYHVVITRDSNYYKVYVNGCLKSTSASTGGALPYYGTSSFDARIGSRERATFFFDGALDDLKVFSCVLTPEQITKLYNNSQPLKITKDTTICADAFKSFKIKAPRTYCTYKWFDLANPTTVIGTDSHYLVNISSTKRFRVVTNSKDTAEVKVTILPKPKLSLGRDTFYCGSVNVTLDGGTGAKSWIWEDNSAGRYHLVKDTGYFFVTKTDSFGCKARDTIRLRTHPLPLFSFGRDTSYCNVFSRTLATTSNASKYIWNTSDTLQSITVNKKGLYWAKVENVFGCSYSDTIKIENPRLSGGFLLNRIDSCLNTNKFLIQDTSKLHDNKKISLTYDFGDLTSSGADTVLKRYRQTGSYTIRQFVKTDYHCVDTSMLSINIWPNSDIGFAINDSLQCQNGNMFNFVNTTSIASGGVNYQWSLGDGTTATSANILAKMYNLDSQYLVRLIARSDKNCYDTLNKSVIVYPNANVSFSLNKTEQCFNGHDFALNSNSSLRNGKIVEYNWHFSDSTSDSGKTILNKRFSYPDTFNVLLQTVTDKGCLDSLIKEFVIHPNTDLKFNVNLDTQCFKWNSFHMMDKSKLKYGSYSLKWDLGDGNTDTAKIVQGKHYSSSGAYKVQLISTTNHQCKDTAFQMLMVYPSPMDSFYLLQPRQCFRGNRFDFTYQSKINSGTITSHQWDLGDGNLSTAMNINGYQYATEDSFNVSLSSRSDKGCLDTFTRLVVTYAQPQADYSIPNDSQCWQKNYFNIVNKTKIKYGQMMHDWDFGDNTSDNSYTPSTKKYANKSADYLVKYRVTSDNGCSDSLNHHIYLFERPIADFSVNDSVQCFRTHLFTFANQTTFSAMNTVSYFWSYGNSDTSMGFSPHQAKYSNPGYKDVQLIAYSYLTNCFDTTIQKVLPAPHAIPDFNINKDSQCLRSNQFVFKNRSQLQFGIMNYDWDFGDGNESQFIDPQKTYLSGHVKTVKLKVTTDKGCADSISKVIVLIPHPVSLFVVNDTAQCLNSQTFNFSNQSSTSYGQMSQKWMFDDGFTSTSTDYSGKIFNQPGYHKVQLIANSYQGCSDTSSSTVFVEKDKNSFIVQNKLDSQCLKGNVFEFQSRSNNSTVTFASHRWFFGDGNQSNLSSSSHSYSSEGKKTVLLETVSLNGCYDSSTYFVKVYPQARPDFEVNSPCFPDQAVFANKTSLTEGWVTKYNWDFGDGGSSALVSPTHFYNSPGSYSVRLISETDRNCIDTIIQPSVAIVRPKPDAGFDFTRLPDKEFEVAILKFRNQSSSDVSSYFWSFGNGQTSTDENPEAEFKDTFRRSVQLIVTNSAGCTDTVSRMTGSLVSDFVFYMPDAFSPGNNGINDVLKPVMTPYVRYYSMEVFNRWGEKVFSTNDLKQGWDGTYMGNDCEQGVYICRIYLVPMRGAIRHDELTITLLR